MSFALSGVRVLDLSRLLPGAFATQMLAELGAEVIKVEDPRGGDPMRHLPPLVNGRGLYDLLLNRGKKSVTIDLKTTGGAAALDRLVAHADVVVESFRPGAARRLGVSGELLRAKYPRLVHCAITGYGQSGPYAERAGHDLNYVAISGVLAADRPAYGKARAGKMGGPPVADLPRMFIADVGGGAMSAVIGILAALFGRERNGEGATLDIAMHEAALYWMMLPAAPDLVGGQEPTGELPTFGAHASYNVYRTKDDEFVALGALEAKFWRAFCEAVGRSDLIARKETDAVDQQAVVRELEALFLTRTRTEWVDWLSSQDCCLTPVNHPAEALTDPHIMQRGTVTTSGGLRVIRPPFASRVPDLAPPPLPGQHNGDILD